MKCSHCNTTMGKGMLIAPFAYNDARYVAPQQGKTATYENMQLVECDKCSECGYSEVDDIALLTCPPQYVNAPYVRDL